MSEHIAVMEAQAKRNLDLMERLLKEKDKLYDELIAIIFSKKPVKNRVQRILYLQAEIEYIRRRICSPTGGIFPTCPEVPHNWASMSHIEKFI